MHDLLFERRSRLADTPVFALFRTNILVAAIKADIVKRLSALSEADQDLFR